MLEGKIKVSWIGLGTHIQKPGGSSLAVVLTQDCLSLVSMTNVESNNFLKLSFELACLPVCDFGKHPTLTIYSFSDFPVLFNGFPVQLRFEQAQPKI